jgi:hypothetical protein
VYEQIQGGAIDDDVMGDDDENVQVVLEPDHARPKDRSAQQIERPFGLLAGQPERLLLTLGRRQSP